MAKLKDGFYKLTASSIGSDLLVLLAGGGAKPISDFASAFNVKLWGNTFNGSSDVNGAIQFATAGNTGSIKFLNGEFIDGYGNVHLGSNSASWNVFDNNQNYLLTILKSGNVGIGTTTPEYTLDVNGTIRAKKSIESIALNDGYWSGGIRIDGTETIRPSVGFHIPNLYGRRLFMEETKGDLMWECSSTSGKPTYYILHSGNYLTFVNKMYWANVLISSTSNATTKPTFSNTIVNGVLTVNGGMKTLAINHNHTLTTPWNDFIACLNPNLTATYHTAHITFGRTYDSKNVGYIGFKYAGNASNSNMVTIGLHSVDNVLNVLASGKVGIGTTSPSELLHVNGTGRVDNIHLKSTYINLNRNGSDSSIYDSTKTALEIEATTDLSILRTYNVTTQASIVLHKNGNVGIGTLTPSAKLHSHGLVKITANSRTLTIGSQNADHCHYSTDSPCHWFNKEVRVVGHVYGGTNYDRRLAYADELLPLTTITKSIRVTTSWLNTGISGDDLGTGSFVVQIVSISDNTNGGLHWSETYTGLMTSFSGATNDGHTDEIPLHRAGHAPNSSILYLRTAREYNSGRMRLQIAGNYNMSAAQNITFKFRRII